jgi:hypothetical protein
MSLFLHGVTRPNRGQVRPGKLRRRIAGVGNNQAQAMGDYHPFGTADTPLTMPITHILMTADGAQVQRLTPLVTANGAAIPASAPGQWGQVYAAGRP